MKRHRINLYGMLCASAKIVDINIESDRGVAFVELDKKDIVQLQLLKAVEDNGGKVRFQIDGSCIGLAEDACWGVIESLSALIKYNDQQDDEECLCCGMCNDGDEVPF